MGFDSDSIARDLQGEDIKSLMELVVDRMDCLSVNGRFGRFGRCVCVCVCVCVFAPCLHPTNHCEVRNMQTLLRVLLKLLDLFWTQQPKGNRLFQGTTMLRNTYIPQSMLY